MFFIFFLLIVPWVGKLYNEYGLELLLPHSGGRGACGSLCQRSAKLAVEAVAEFWHCVLDFGLVFCKKSLVLGSRGSTSLFLIIEICRFGKQQPLLVDFFQRIRTERT